MSTRTCNVKSFINIKSLRLFCAACNCSLKFKVQLIDFFTQSFFSLWMCSDSYFDLAATYTYIGSHMVCGSVWFLSHELCVFQPQTMGNSILHVIIFFFYLYIYFSSILHIYANSLKYSLIIHCEVIGVVEYIGDIHIGRQKCDKAFRHEDNETTPQLSPDFSSCV